MDPSLVEIAQSRVYDGDFRVGDMENLPWGDDTFDLVTGLNSFFIADDMGAALKEARRAARPGSSVALTVFGRPDHCDSTEMFGAVRRLVMGDEAPAPDGDDGPKLHDPGVLEEMARGAGLDPVEAEFLEFTETYPRPRDPAAGVLAAPPMRRAIQATREEAVRDPIAQALASAVSETGQVTLHEEGRCLIART